jgi:hypothetical protein
MISGGRTSCPEIKTPQTKNIYMSSKKLKYLLAPILEHWNYFHKSYGETSAAMLRGTGKAGSKYYLTGHLVLVKSPNSHQVLALLPAFLLVQYHFALVLM